MRYTYSKILLKAFHAHYLLHDIKDLFLFQKLKD